MTEETRSLSLAEALPLEIERVKKIIKIYKDPILKGAGRLASTLMEIDVSKAQEAIIEQDTVAMIRAYNELKNYEV